MFKEPALLIGQRVFIVLYCSGSRPDCLQALGACVDALQKIPKRVPSLKQLQLRNAKPGIKSYELAARITM